MSIHTSIQFSNISYSWLSTSVHQQHLQDPLQTLLNFLFNPSLVVVFFLLFSFFLFFPSFFATTRSVQSQTILCPSSDTLLCLKHHIHGFMTVCLNPLQNLSDSATMELTPNAIQRIANSLNVPDPIVQGFQFLLCVLLSCCSFSTLFLFTVVTDVEKNNPLEKTNLSYDIICLPHPYYTFVSLSRIIFCRFSISDGSHIIGANFHPSNKEIYRSQPLQKGSIIKLRGVSTKQVNNDTLFLIFRFFLLPSVCSTVL